MTKTVIIIITVITLIALIVFGISHFGKSFLNSYSPPHITITKNEIISSGGFMDPVTIEKLKIHSLGKENRPTKYTIEYVATCSIKQKEGDPLVALNKIKLNEPGRYSWTGETVHIPVSHADGLSIRVDSAPRSNLNPDRKILDTCPTKFENNNWYFINFQDPIFIGVYVYVDNAGIMHQYAAYSSKN